MKIFGREPVYWLSGLQAALAMAVAIPAFHFTPTAAAWVVTVGTGAIAVVEAFAVKPRTVASLVGAVKTFMAWLVMFGLVLPAGLDNAIVAFTTFVLGAIMVKDVTPAAFPDLSWLRAREGTAPATVSGRHA